MENLVLDLLEKYETGKINRRQLITTLTLGSSVASIVGSEAQAATALSPTTGIDHISYTVADYRKTRDFYSRLLGVNVTDDDGTRCRLHVGNLTILARNGPAPTPLIDHIGYAIPNWNRDAVFAELKRRGLDPQPPKSGKKTSANVKDPDGYLVQLVEAGRE